MTDLNNIQNAFKKAEEEQLLNIPAKRILNKTKDIPSEVDSLKRRWFWELLQNASDYNEEVEVALELFNDKIIFKHNGLPFTPMDVRNLIAPDSGKDNSDLRTEDTIGQFGTGFISTHVLSSIITVEGIVEVDSQFAPFTFDLDRSGYNNKEFLKNSISYASAQLKLDKGLVDYNPKNFNTKFKYDITSPLPGVPINDVIISGLEFVDEVLPYTLAFMPKIRKVTIVNNSTKFLPYYKREYTQKIKNRFIVEISTFENDRINLKTNSKEFYLSRYKNATLIINVNEDIILQYPQGVTKLFCSLPMIGTENFSFPVVINSSKFNPKTERDGIRLSIAENSNREILMNAVYAFKMLVNELVKNNFKKFYHIVKLERYNSVDNIERTWFSNNITAQLKSFLLTQPIVITQGGIRVTLNDVKIPYFPKENNQKDALSNFYSLVSVYMPNIVPQESDFYYWYANIDFSLFSGCKYELNDLLLAISDHKSLHHLEEIINGGKTWLNSLIALVLKIDENLLDQFAIIPNQLGIFKLRKDPIFWDSGLDIELINIYNLINEDDYRHCLLHKDFEVNTRILENSRTKNISDLAKSIDDCFAQYPENNRMNDEFQQALRLMFKWFADSGKSDVNLKDLFKWFSDKKPTLFLETFDDLSRDRVFAISQSGKLDSLSKLAESKITDEELKEVTSNIEDVVKLTQVLKEVNGGMDLILNYAELIREDKEDFNFKKYIGETIESVFKNALLNSEIDAEIINNGWSASDFEIRNIKNGKCYFIELKTIAYNNKGKIKLSISQAQKAIKNPENYSLAVLERPRDFQSVGVAYLKYNIKSKNNMASLLDAGIQDYEKINSIRSYNRLHLIFREEIRLIINRDSFLSNCETFYQLIERIKNHLK